VFIFEYQAYGSNRCQGMNTELFLSLNFYYANGISTNFTNCDGCSVSVFDTVGKVVDLLSDKGLISTTHTLSSSNSIGGFEGVTDPNYILTYSNENSATNEDLYIISNALGYVFSQGSNAIWSTKNVNAYTSTSPYVTVTFSSTLTPTIADDFYSFLGTIDPTLYTGTNAGFTQIGNSMFFLKPKMKTSTFDSEMQTGVDDTPGTTISAEGTASAEFPSNNWVKKPKGESYLSALGSSISDSTKCRLAQWRIDHLVAVQDFYSISFTLPTLPNVC